MPEIESVKGPKWGDRTIKAVSTDSLLMDAYAFVSGIPIIHWIFGIIEMILIRFWLWLHSLPLPDWVQTILDIIDRILEKIIVVISWIIHWIFGDRHKHSKSRAAVNKHQSKLNGTEK